MLLARSCARTASSGAPTAVIFARLTTAAHSAAPTLLLRSSSRASLSMLAPLGAAANAATPRRGPKASGKKKGEFSSARDGLAEGELCFNFHTMKEGAQPTELKDNEYPEWIWALATPQPSLTELEKAEFWHLPHLMKRRMFKLKNRAAIKEHNRDNPMNKANK
jgi:hypothetical protein